MCLSKVPSSTKNDQGQAEFGRGVVRRLEDAGLETEVLHVIPISTVYKLHDWGIYLSSLSFRWLHKIWQMGVISPTFQVGTETPPLNAPSIWPGT